MNKSDNVIEVKVFADHEQKDWADNIKLGVDIVMPVITLIFGILILRLTKKLERSQWMNQKIIEKRISEWDQIRNEVNDIFCYCTRVGGWKSFSPEDVISLKRTADKKMYLARPYFSKDFFNVYLRFMRTCFEHYQGYGVDAKIKSPLWEHQQGYRGTWDQSWNNMFFQKYSTDEELWGAYEAMLFQVANDLGD